MLYNWNSTKYYEFWPPWSRKFGCVLQLLPLFIVPLVGVIQSYLYLTAGPVDLFEVGNEGPTHSHLISRIDDIFSLMFDGRH